MTPRDREHLDHDLILNQINDRAFPSPHQKPMIEKTKKL